MPVVGCPKCKKKYKLSSEVLGKTVRCTECQTKFKTAAKQTGEPSAPPNQANRKAKGRNIAPKQSTAAAGGATRASTAPLKGVGLSGPISPQSDLFAQPIPDKRSPDPLGNFVLEDPGFGNVDLDEMENDDDDDLDVRDDDKRHLFENPALKAAAATKASQKTQRKSQKPVGFKEIRMLGNVVVALGGLGIACCCVGMVFQVLVLFQVNGSGSGTDGESGVGIGQIFLLAGGSLWGLSSLTSLIYWPLAHANTTALGATEQRFSPMWMVFGWLIPLANLVWPMQGVTEILKASKKPSGKKWRKLSETYWQTSAWTVSVIAAPLCPYVGSYFLNAGGGASHTSVLLKLASIVVYQFSLFCVLSLIMQTTKTQYKNFE